MQSVNMEKWYNIIPRFLLGPIFKVGKVIYTNFSERQGAFPFRSHFTAEKGRYYTLKTMHVYSNLAPEREKLLVCPP